MDDQDKRDRETHDPKDEHAAPAAPAAPSRTAPEPRILTRNEREALRARLQKTFH